MCFNAIDVWSYNAEWHVVCGTKTSIAAIVLLQLIFIKSGDSFISNFQFQIFWYFQHEHYWQHIP